MDFKITLKRSYDGWVEVGGVKFKLKYPTINQGREIEKHIDKMYSKVGEGEELKLSAFNEYKRYCIRVWIENWDQMTENNKSEPVPCLLVDDGMGGKYLEEDLWWSLVRDMNYVNELFKTFEDELFLTNSDKKK